MSSVVISGDTSGAITLQAPAVAGNTTLNLPASSGTVLTQNSSAPANSFVVDASGNVGIGTASPSGKLDISGDMYLRDGGGNAVVYTTNGLFYRHGNSSSYTDVLLVDSSYNLKFNSGYGSAATAYGCRAWVNFNGTGTVAIRASGNVSSITDNGTGDYTVNFTTAMPDANYATNVNAVRNSTADTNMDAAFNKNDTYSSSAVRFRTVVASVDGRTAEDAFQAFVAVFR